MPTFTSPEDLFLPGIKLTGKNPIAGLGCQLFSV